MDRLLLIFENLSKKLRFENAAEKLLFKNEAKSLNFGVTIPPPTGIFDLTFDLTFN